jgi:hypothetical protein
VLGDDAEEAAKDHPRRGHRSSIGVLPPLAGLGQQQPAASERSGE